MYIPKPLHKEKGAAPHLFKREARIEKGAILILSLLLLHLMTRGLQKTINTECTLSFLSGIFLFSRNYHSFQIHLLNLYVTIFSWEIRLAAFSHNHFGTRWDLISTEKLTTYLKIYNARSTLQYLHESIAKCYQEINSDVLLHFRQYY